MEKTQRLSETTKTYIYISDILFSPKKGTKLEMILICQLRSHESKLGGQLVQTLNGAKADQLLCTLTRVSESDTPLFFGDM